MIGGALDLAAGIWTACGRALSAVGRWFRTSRNWWRVGFFGMGLVAMVAACAVWDRQNAYAAAVALREADARTCAATIAGLTAELDAHRAVPGAIAAAVAAETERLRVAQQQNADALAALAAGQVKAAQDNAAWWASYRQRPMTCQAAQQALDTACADLRGY